MLEIDFPLTDEGARKQYVYIRTRFGDRPIHVVSGRDFLCGSDATDDFYIGPKALADHAGAYEDAKLCIACLRAMSTPHRTSHDRTPAEQGEKP